LSRGTSEDRAGLVGALEREARLGDVRSAFFFQAIADRIGMHVTDLQCSNVLELIGSMPAGKLAEITGLTTGAVTGVINRLEKAGYARRERDPDDGRRVIVRLVMEAAQRDLGPHFESIGKAWDKLVSGYDDEELAFCLDFMSRANAMTLEETAKLREQTAREGARREFSAPLGSKAEGHLVFAAGASHLTLSAGTGEDELYRARFEGPVPTVRTEGGTVTVRYPKGRGPLDWRKREGEVELNTSIPWGVELRGGTARINADLKLLALRSFDLKGGASKLLLELQEPWGVVPVRLTGGASNVSIRRPAGTAARLRVKGGASQLLFDGQSIGAVGGYVSLHSEDYDENAPDRYEVEISGGATNVSVDTF
jgi:DNA-binding MarR family transcriptional regulator